MAYSERFIKKTPEQLKAEIEAKKKQKRLVENPLTHEMIPEELLKKEMKEKREQPFSQPPER